MDRLEQLSAFVEVARRQSFAQAAQQLGRHVSAVSRAVAALESRLGVRLLQRTTRRVTLIDAGRDYFKRCETLLAEFDGADAEVRELAASLRGTLRVSAATGAGQTLIAPIVPQFLAAHPLMSLDLQLSNRYVDLVEEGYDLALRVGTLAADSRLVVRRLEQFVRVAHRLQGGSGHRPAAGIGRRRRRAQPATAPRAARLGERRAGHLRGVSERALHPGEGARVRRVRRRAPARVGRELTRHQRRV